MVLTDYYLLEADRHLFPLAIVEENEQRFILSKSLPAELLGKEGVLHIVSPIGSTLVELDFHQTSKIPVMISSRTELTRLPMASKTIRPVPHLEIQNNAIHAKEFLNSYHEWLLQEITTAKPEGFLVVAAENVPVSIPATFDWAEGLVKINIDSSNRILTHLRYTNLAKFVVPTFKNFENLEIRLILDKQIQDGIQTTLMFLIDRLSYGSHTELETLRYPLKVSHGTKFMLKDLSNRFRLTMAKWRFPLVILGIIPVLLTLAWIMDNGVQINYLHGFLILCAFSFLLIASNLLNDFFDSLLMSDEFNPFVGSFRGGSGFIQKEISSELSILFQGILFLTFGSLLGLTLIFESQARVILLAISSIGIFLAFSFSAPPLKLSSRGLGELILPIEFGFLPVLGTMLLFVPFSNFGQAVLMDFFWLALFSGFSMLSVGFLNGLLDYIPDFRASKKTMVVRIGKSNSHYAFKLCLLVPFLLISAWLTMGKLSMVSSIFLFGIPAVVKLLKLEDIDQSNEKDGSQIFLMVYWVIILNSVSVFMGIVF